MVVAPRLSTQSPVSVKVRNPKAQQEGATYVSYIQFKTTFRRAVILGDPGGGKSTLTQLLCYNNSNSIVLESSFPGKPQIDSTELRVPLRIILRSFDKRRQNSPNYSFFRHLIDSTADIFDHNPTRTAQLLRYFLSVGNAILIFDGLDEILEVEQRREIVSLIEQFTNTYPGCPCIITSRFVGYRDAPLSDEFSVYHLAAFNNEEVGVFAKKFIKIIEGIKVDAARQKAEKFISQTNNIATDLGENPLMLGLMVYLFVYRGDVPSNRPEIYKECATLMFEKWDQRRDIIFQIPVDFDLLDLFSYLASRIFGSADTEDGVSREWLTTELRRFFENWYVDKAKALHAARALVDFITGRAWVMFEIGPRVYKFTHRTFLEYFFARHLLSSSESVSALVRDHLLEKIIKSEWEMISHLALQTAVFRDSGKMTQAADTLVSVLQNSRFKTSERIAFLSFVIETLDYLLLPEVRFCAIVELVCRHIIYTGGKEDVTAVSLLGLLIKYTKKREGLAKSAVYRVFKETLKEVSSPCRAFAVFATARNDYYRGFLLSHRLVLAGSGRPLWMVARANGNFFYGLRKELQQTNKLHAMDNVEEARLYLFSYETDYLEVFKKHGWNNMALCGSSMIGKNLPNSLLELVRTTLIREELLSTEIQQEILPNIEELWAAVEFVVAGIARGEMVKGAAFPKIGRSVNVGLIRDVLGMVYNLMFKRKRRDPDKPVKALYVTAFIIDLTEFGLSAGRFTNEADKDRAQALKGYLPPGVIESIFAAIRPHPLSVALEDWNNGKTSFVGAP